MARGSVDRVERVIVEQIGEGRPTFASVSAEDYTTPHRLTVGAGDIETARAFSKKWEAAGWHVVITIGSKSRRKPFREPYDPVRCPSCNWAGLNLGQHFRRAHGGSPPPGTVLVADVVKEQARAARSVTERNRVPRVGIIVVRQPSDVEMKTYRIEKVENGVVDLFAFDIPERRTIMRATGGTSNLKRVSLELLLSDYLPVGRWRKT